MGNLRLAVLAILLAHSLVALAQQEVIVAIDEPGKTQYHEANFNTSAYQFGYEVGPNGQFHHETRGPDGVTYGCYGYIDPNGLLRVTHYVADTHGYRVVEPNHPVEIFMDAPSQYSNAITDEDPKVRHRGQVVPWKDLYLPRGCGMYPGGLRPDGPPVTPPPQNPGGFTAGAGISQTGISGSLMTSHNTTVHTGGTSIGGSVGTTGVHGSSSHNSSGSIFGATYNHTSVSSGSLDGQGVHGGHTGSNSFNSTHVSVSGNTDVEGHFQGGQVTVGGTVNHTETLAVGSVNVSSTSGGSFGGELGPEYVGGEVSGMLVTNASISAPLIGPQQGSVTVGGGGSIGIGRPPQEVSTEYPYGPSPSQTPEPVYTTPQPNYPTASGVQPPTRPIETGPPPPSNNNNNNQYPPYQIAVSQYPYFFVPYPYAPPPTVPQAPCNCPQDQNRPNQPAGYLGFIPVIYVPNCNAQQRGLPTHINWPAPPPPEGFGRALDQLPPFQRLVQGPDGSWTVQQDPTQQQEAQPAQPEPQPTQQPLPRPRQNRGRRLRSRRPPLLQLAGVPFAKSSSAVGGEQETQVETQV